MTDSNFILTVSREALPRTRTVGEILDKSVDITVRLLGPLSPYYLTIGALSSLNVILPTHLAQRSESFSSFLISGSLTVGGVIVSGILSLYLHCVAIFTSAALWRGGDIDTNSANVRPTVGILFRLFVLRFRIGLATFFYFLFFLIPGILYSINRCIADCIMLLENCNSDWALKRSKRLMTFAPGIPWYSTRTPQMRVSAIYLLFTLLSAAQWAIFHVGYDPEDSTQIAWTTFLWLFGVTTISEVMVIAGVVAMVGFYYDLRTRDEGLDIRGLLTLSDR